MDRKQIGGMTGARSSGNAGKAHRQKDVERCQGDSLRLFEWDQSCMVFVGIASLPESHVQSGNLYSMNTISF